MSSQLLVVEFNLVMKAFTYFNFFKGIDCEYRHDVLDVDRLTQYRNAQRKCVAIIDCPYLVKPATDLSMFDLVIVMDPETCFCQPSDRIKELQKHFSNDNIITIAGGISTQDKIVEDERFILLPWLMLEISLVNDQYKLTSTAKPKMFDALLGLNRPHRRYIFEQLKNSNLLDQGYVSLLNNTSMNDDHSICYRSPELNQVEEIDIQSQLVNNLNIFKSFDRLRPHTSFPSIKTRASAVVPAKIYDSSYFSIVAETLHEHGYFFTEKTAKPLHSMRPFIMFGTPRMLDALRKYGFETFSEVIDESYDQVLNHNQRFNMAFEQVQRLCQENFNLVYQKLKPKLKHNQDLLVNHEYFCQPVADKIEKFLP